MCKVVEVRRAVLAENDTLAAALRAELTARGTLLVNLLSSPGSGKTALLERLLGCCAEGGMHVAALTADLATENDARRLARAGVPVQQVLTGGLCHLECEQLRARLDGWLPDGTEVLFVENVGNLVCPAAYDLGERLRIALMSVTEGEDKPLKYPAAFGLAHLVVLTKTDLLTAVGFDSAAFERHVAAVNPGVEVVHTSARTGDGLQTLLERVRAVCHGATPHRPVLAARHLSEFGHDHGSAAAPHEHAASPHGVDTDPAHAPEGDDAAHPPEHRRRCAPAETR
ncbi:hydrogenase nickel incorporation protein HypB [Streptomyces odontomachi]|uniref:hydrogenase nickel incorporation protein HypB n=1 Tax=Streptomyces odontomachi TaxID=2944940 RepID=UPI002108E6F6|nr:hydrogenase nickel incorporation protein HypB [Streptomyces sp. ODS25]